MTRSKGTEIEISIESLALGGRGVGRLNGEVVFVDRGLPGARVRAVLTRERGGHLEAELVEELVPHEHPAEPVCPHFGLCGGCDFQDLAYGRQLYWKRGFVAEALSRIGGVEAEVGECIASPEAYGYRNKMEFAFCGLGNKPALGLRVRNRPGRVFDLQSCALMAGPVGEMVGLVRDFARSSGEAAYDADSGKGLWRYLVLRRNRAGRMLVQLITAPGKHASGLARGLAAALTSRFPEVGGVVHGLRRKRRSQALAEKSKPVWGKDLLTEELAGVRFLLTANSFFQVNTPAAEGLYALARDAAELEGGELVYDLYAGVGGLGLFTACGAREVRGFEMVREAVAAAEKNARLNRAQNVSFVAGDLAKSLADPALPRPDVVVADPPRTGLAEGVLARVAALAPRRIVYVSCNPATLARDAARLAPGYRLLRATPVDMFPQTAHVEAVAVFDRA